MAAWGTSCDSLLTRLEQCDPTLKELVVLPTKSFGDAEVMRLVKVLESRSNPFWTNLSASGHAVSNEVLFLLGQAIGRQTVMTSLAIGNKDMGDDGVVALCDGLAAGGTSPLLAIDLSYKGLRRRGLMSIFETLGASNLQRLDLSRNLSICTCRLRLREELAEGTSIFKKLEMLNLSDCNVDNEFVEDLQTLIQPHEPMSLRLDGNPNITVLPTLHSHVNKLYISGCQISDGAMKQLSEMESSSMQGLQLLDMSKNEITSDGAQSLASALYSSKNETSRFPNLLELDLSGNALDESGVMAILSALAIRGKTMATLDLSETHCGTSGAVAAAFECPVASLRLFGNQLGAEGFFALASAIRTVQTLGLSELDLSGNGATASAVTALLNALIDIRIPIQLTSLVIGGNANNPDVEATIALLKERFPHMEIARDKLRRAGSTSNEMT